MTQDADAGTDQTSEGPLPGTVRAVASAGGGASSGDGTQELLRRVSELEAANAELSDLIVSSDIPMLLLDTRLRVRRFSDRLRALVRSEGGVQVGRPLAELDLRVRDRALIADAHRAMRRAMPIEAEVEGPGGTWYARRIVPRRSAIDTGQSGGGNGRPSLAPHGSGGLVVTFSEISSLHRAVEALERRSRRQASLADLGRLALGSEDLPALLDRAAGNVSAQLDAPFVEIQELVDGGNALELRAGAGWSRATAGAASTGREPLAQRRSEIGADTHAAYALRQAEPVEITNFDTETRFEATELLRAHGVVCGVCSLVGPRLNPWGVIGIYRDRAEPFSEDDVAHLQAMANILWLAVAQDRSRQIQDAERRRLRQLIDGLPVMIGVVNADLRFEIGNRCFEAIGWIAEELEGVRVADVIGEAAYAQGAAGFAAALAGRSASFEMTVQRGGGPKRVYLAHNVPRLMDGDLDGFYLAMIDITDRKRAEERNAVISSELDHRVKNILALVMTIARMTGRTTEDHDSFTATFEDRIHSLARTHAHLADTDWAGMSLRDLLLSELEAYVDLPSKPVSLVGERLWLSREPVQSLALACHELVTNAVKYGALSKASGRLEVLWRLEEGGSVAIEWTEHGLTGLTEPSRQGFGRTVIESAVVQQLRGKVTFDFRPTGLRCVMQIPADAIVGDRPDD